MSELSQAIRDINIQLEFIRKKYPDVFRVIIEEAEIDFYIFKVRKLPNRMFFMNLSVKYSNIGSGKTTPDLSRALMILARASETYHFGKDGVISKQVEILNLPRTPKGTAGFLSEMVHRIRMPE
ncbi:hypothetical protein [Labrenzia sp. OB1]|uniref:hypothetical protein n=1 Tax=Labrenzia sp. OB1 TaxID=1561204 RepID=UPI0007B279A5|nr:hypothetical protein [Labrenzia sp. OB1]KZM44085.1 hypothetical protein OA90_27085 [Labrenzia sp. OB1]